MSIWADRLPDARVLDLFAGSGAVGLEALSRGAATVVLVEGDREAFQVLVRNCAVLAPEGARPLQLLLPEGLRSGGEQLASPFDLVFADPPYVFESYANLLSELAPHVGRSTGVAIEHGAEALREELPQNWDETDRRRYGDSWLSFFRFAGAPTPG